MKYSYILSAIVLAALPLHADTPPLTCSLPTDPSKVGDSLIGLAKQIANSGSIDRTALYVKMTSDLAGCPAVAGYYREDAITIQRILDYAKIQANLNGPHASSYQMGFEIDDDSYAQARPSGAVALPKLVADGLPSGGVDAVRQAVTAADASAQVLRYTSASVTHAPNNSRDRLLIKFSPEEIEVSGSEKYKYEKFVNFTVAPLNASPAADPERMIDVIAIEREEYRSGEWKKLDRPRIHFEEYWTDAQGKNPVRRLLSDNHAANRCTSCHATGLRQIVPEPGSIGKAQLGILANVNDQISSVGLVDWGASLHLAKMGPVHGLSYVGCVKCHSDLGNGLSAQNFTPRSYTRGSLTSIFNMDQIQHKLVGDLSMPPVDKEDLAGQEVIRALRLVDQLSDDDRANVVKDFDGHNPEPSTIIESLQAHGLLAPNGINYNRVKAKLAVMLSERTFYFKRLDQLKDYDLAGWLVQYQDFSQSDDEGDGAMGNGHAN